MNSSNILFYTQPGCPSCHMAKDWLNEHGYSYDERDVTKEEQDFLDLTQKYKSQSTPTLVVGTEVVVGFTPERYTAVLKDLPK